MRQNDPHLQQIISRLAREIDVLQRRVTSVEKDSQSRFRAIEDGSLQFFDEDEVLRTTIGIQDDGSFTIQDFNGPPPETPSDPIVVGRPAMLVVAWDGFTATQLQYDADFLRVEVHVSATPSFTPTDATQLHAFTSKKGEEVTLGLEAGTYYVKLVAVNTSNAESDPTGEFEATVTAPGAQEPVEPGSSPTPEATGMKGAIFVKWPGIANASPVSYELHVSTSTGFVPTPGDTATMYVRTAATSSVVTTLPNGDSLLYDTDYFFKVIAVATDDVDLAAAPGGEDVEQMSKVALDDVVASSILAAVVQAINVEAESLTIGQEGGRQILMSLANGIRLLGSDGITTLVDMPLDGSAVKMTAEVIATFLTVTLGLEVRGTGNEISTGGGLFLASQITTPNTSPQVTVDYETVVHTAVSADHDQWGLVKVGTDFYEAHFDFAALEIDSHIKQYNADGSLGTSVQVDATGLTEPEAMGLTYGNAGQGNRFFVLIQDFNSPFDFFIQVRDATTPSASTFVSNTNIDSALTWNGKPTIGWDYEHNRVIVATFNSAGTIISAKSYTENASNVMVNDTSNNGTWTSPTLAATSTTLGFISRGLFDYGVSRMVIKNGTGSADPDFRTFTITSPAEQVNEKWPIANGSGRVRGAWYDGTDFWSMSGSNRQRARYTRNKWTTESSTWWLSYTWYDSDATGGTHETARSPRSSVTMKKRARVVYSTADPADTGGTDDPDQVRFYLARGSTDPASTSHWLQGANTAGEFVLTNATFTGTNPPTSNNFPAGVPAFVKSQTGDLEIYGDGLLKVTNIRGDRITGSNTRSAAPYAVITKNGNQTIGDTTEADLNLGTLGEETDSTMGDTANSQIVVPIAGVYLVIAHAEWDNNTAGSRVVRLMKNGISETITRIRAATTGNDKNILVHVMRLAANDTLSLKVGQTSGGNLALLGTAGERHTYLAARWLSP